MLLCCLSLVVLLVSKMASGTPGLFSSIGNAVLRVARLSSAEFVLVCLLLLLLRSCSGPPVQGAVPGVAYAPCPLALRYHVPDRRFLGFDSTMCPFTPWVFGSALFTTTAF